MRQEQYNLQSFTKINQKLELDVQGLTTAVFDISNTFVGTVIFEYQINNNAAWKTLTVTPIPQAAGVTGATAAGSWKVDVSGFVRVRVRVTAFTSGQIDTAIRAVIGASTGIGTAAGDATAANQVTGNNSLSSIDSKIPVSPSTSGKQDTGNTSLASIDTKTIASALVSVSQEKTRPGDTTAYAALDVVADSTSSPTVFTFTGAARVVGGAGYITKAQLATDQKTNVARFRLHLFNAAPTAINDNSPFLTLYANKASYVGYIDFPAATTEDATNSTQAIAQAVSGSATLPLPFVAGADANLYGILETLDVFTPANGQKVNVKLVTDQY